MIGSAEESLGFDRSLALDYVNDRDRAAVAALWRLDATLGQVVATTTQAMIGQMRLTWWHGKLMALGELHGEPVLADLAANVLPRGIDGVDLAALVEGWEEILDPLPLDDTTLLRYASARGIRLFSLTRRLLVANGADDAGAGWALADFARRCSDADTKTRAYTLARERLSPPLRLPRPLRLIARLAADDARAGVALPRTRLQLLRAAW